MGDGSVFFENEYLRSQSLIEAMDYAWFAIKQVQLFRHCEDAGRSNLAFLYVICTDCHASLAMTNQPDHLDTLMTTV
jgi:hypothetical protein